MNIVAEAAREQDTVLDLDLGLSWRNSFAALGPDFYTTVQPRPLPEPYWVGRSQLVADALGLTPAIMDSRAALSAFTGNLGLAGARPLAPVYSGHQFGVWAGQLGDGRACLLGEVATPGPPGPAPPGLRKHRKGPGPTPK